MTAGGATDRVLDVALGTAWTVVAVTYTAWVLFTGWLRDRIAAMLR